ncbi:MAG: homoserine dehydrogenase, partial [Microbacterium sp.]|nr:homoserine dehydrogenase [Microbacterium sp.]
VSVATLEQTIVADGDVQTARLVIGTHTAREQDLSDAVASLGESGVVKRVVSVLRVEGD